MTRAFPSLMLASTASPPEDDVNLTIGRRIRRRRRLMGLTQQDLANVLGVRPQQVQKYECSGSRVSAARLFALASALKVSVTYFFSGLPDEPANDAESGGRNSPGGAELPDEKSAQEMLDVYMKLPERLRRNLRVFAKSMQEEIELARSRRAS